MNRRHFGIEDESPTGFFELSIHSDNNGRQELRGGGGVHERSRVSVVRFAIELLQKKACFWLYRVKPSRSFC